MHIEILVVPDCPNQQLAETRLRRALDDAGLVAVTVTTRLISDPAEAERAGFAGSPTILIDGVDPFAQPGATPSLSCRIYRTPDGPAGAPDAGQLRQAVARAATAEN